MSDRKIRIMGMANMDLLVKAWDESFWEYSLVFEGLGDEDVWRRADPKLLSIGELTGHVAFWEASMADPPSVVSPLVSPDFRYFTTNEPNPVVLSLGASEVAAELKRIHEETRASVLLTEKDSEDLVAGSDWTWGYTLRYRSFHVAYHAGQAYSIRHLLGHTPTDN